MTVRGGSLVPFNPAVQRNVLLAANNTWLGNDGMTGVKLDGFEESGDSVAMRLRVGVTQPQAPAAANFIQTTVTAGTLDAAFRDEGGQLFPWVASGGKLPRETRTSAVHHWAGWAMPTEHLASSHHWQTRCKAAEPAWH